MPRPDYNKVTQMFDPFDNGEPEETEKHKRMKKKKSKVPTNKGKFLEKLEEERFEDFDRKDWYQYFCMKFENETGRKYMGRDHMKSYSIFDSLAKELSPLHIKLMIDFVFDSDQDIKDKRTVGTWILSKGFIQTIYQNAMLWNDGEYKPAKAPKHNREYVAEASSKEQGTGINYGKPVKDKDKLEQKRKNKKIWF